MILRNILNHFRRAGQDALDVAMTVESRPTSLVHKDFREFTAPARQQRGGALRIPVRGADRIARIGIVPDVGGNIP